MIKRYEEITELPLLERLDLAAKATFEKLIADRRRTGDPLVVMRNGKVVHLKPSPLPVEQWEEINGKP